MKPELPRLAALSAVIGQDLSAIRRLDAELTTLRAGVTAAQPAFRDLAAAAYLLHNLYNAMENAFEQISRTFENHITDPAQWHKELLGKMFLDIPTVRPAVLPPELRGFLSELRAFRHIFRHSYDYELDAERLGDLVQAWTGHRDAILDALTAFADCLMVQVRKEP